MRRSLVTAPSGGESFERMSRMTLSFDLLHRHEVQDFLHHPSERGGVRHGDFGARPAQSEALHHEPLWMRHADDASDLPHLQELLHAAPPSTGLATSTGCAP